MTKQTQKRHLGEQTKFVLQLDRAADHPILQPLHSAMQAKHILLPDGELVSGKALNIALFTQTAEVSQ